MMKGQNQLPKVVLVAAHSCRGMNTPPMHAFMNVCTEMNKYKQTTMKANRLRPQVQTSGDPMSVFYLH